MKYYKIEITYPNGEYEIVDEDFLSIKSALESAEHLLGQVNYNAQFHKSFFDKLGESKDVEPFFLIKEVEGEEKIVVYDSRKK